MAVRKTVNVAALVEITNRKNQFSTCSPDVRHGWNGMLEEILQMTGTYAGFGCYTEKDVPMGEKPGIIYGTTRNDAGVIVDNTFPDETRRFYYLHPSLKV